MSAQAQILCTKCTAVSAEPRPDCVKCGGKNARVCGKCGNQNSVAKNFCDKCGQPISDLGPIAPPPKTVLPGSPSADIPATVVKRIVPAAPPPAEPAGKPLPAAREKPAPLGMPGQPAAGFDDLWSAPAAPPVAAETVTRPAANRWRAALNALAAAAGLAAAAYGVWTYREMRRPEILVPKLAARYLEALRTRDYERAYGMFSDAAKRNATLDEFRASRDTTTWTWSGLSIEYREPGAMLLGYDLKADGAAPRRDHLLFTLEGENWTRPYNWTLMRAVEEAFDKGDADKGLILAQAAATVNPRDPMAWGYLCEAAYYRKLPADTELRCVRALELARTYPSNLSLKSLYHLHAILADTYHHALRSPEKALEQYAEMLAFPEISPADQCQILLARAQAYASISRPGEALADLDRGSQLCAEPADQAFIQRMREAIRAPDAQ
ncbi:MAG TPA: zinc ribbon domain-containing protein [Elusimicrobiota bacterium]|nr:zinc ribbon domain-containing protein [Elusimicrobiota bacterium]